MYSTIQYLNKDKRAKRIIGLLKIRIHNSIDSIISMKTLRLLYPNIDGLTFHNISIVRTRQGQSVTIRENIINLLYFFGAKLVYFSFKIQAKSRMWKIGMK